MSEIELNPQLLSLIFALLGLFFGIILTFLIMLSKRNLLKSQLEAEIQKNGYLQEKEAERQTLLETLSRTETAFVEAEKTIIALETAASHERKNFQEKIALMEQAEQRLKETFQNLSSEALTKNSTSFIEVAKLTFEKIQQSAQQDLEARQQSIADFVKPMRESLDKIDSKIQEVEKTRAGAYEGLKSQIHNLLDAQKDLRTETVNLVHALKTPQVRGRWGEIQLKRVVEMAGMVDHCDFMEQVSTQGPDEQDARLRPDMVVSLPGGQRVIIDAKAPMRAYLEGMETNDETQKKQKQLEHARLIRQHIKQLSTKAYWSQFDPSPEFVVLFLPGEQFFSAALQQDPGLIELGADNKVLLATPTTLIALLRAVAYGWRQEKLAQNAYEISQLGQALYDRLADMTQHLTKLGRHLGQTVQAYNQSVGSFEQRVMVSARRFENYGVNAKKPTDPLTPIETKERELLGS